MKMLRLGIFLILFIFSGCALHIPDADDIIKVETIFNHDIFSRGGKALVVIEEKNNIPSDIKLHGKLTFIDQEGRRFIFEVNKTGVFMLDPGTYVMENFELYGSKGYLSAHLNYGKRYKAYFAIAPEDVVYIGKINTRILYSKATSESSKHRKEVVTITTLSEEISSLPTAFLSEIQQQTGKGLEPRLMHWTDTILNGDKTND